MRPKRPGDAGPLPLVRTAADRIYRAELYARAGLEDDGNAAICYAAPRLHLFKGSGSACHEHVDARAEMTKP